jgi:hypothetical protein
VYSVCISLLYVQYNTDTECHRYRQVKTYFDSSQQYPMYSVCHYWEYWSILSHDSGVSLQGIFQPKCNIIRHNYTQFCNYSMSLNNGIYFKLEPYQCTISLYISLIYLVSIKKCIFVHPNQFGPNIYVFGSDFVFYLSDRVF